MSKIVLPYQERVARIMFLREHRRNLLRDYCNDEVTKKEKDKLRQEIARVQKALKELDPDGMFPPRSIGSKLKTRSGGDCLPLPYSPTSSIG